MIKIDHAGWQPCAMWVLQARAEVSFIWGDMGFLRGTGLR